MNENNNNNNYPKNAPGAATCNGNPYYGVVQNPAVPSAGIPAGPPPAGNTPPVPPPVNTPMPPPAGAPAQQIPNNYYTAAIKPKKEWGFAPKDAVFAILMFVLGMLFWDWVFNTGSLYVNFGISVTVFFVTAAVMTGIYLHSLGFRQNSRSIPALVILLAGSLPFALYDTIDIFVLLILFEFAVALIWVMNTCKTSFTKSLSGYILMDIINQVFVVSFANFAGAFRALAYGSRNKSGSKRGLYSFIGILVSIPVIAGVIALLMAADQGFANVMYDIAEAINLENIGRYLIELLVGIPVACYVFGSVFGNGHGRYTDSVTKAGTDASLAGMHKIPLAAVRAPLGVLTGIYVLFFIAMGAYLFSAFNGALPSDYTYSEYARRGFFELCGVAAINLALIIFVYLFAKRGAGEYPKSVRVLTGIISSMTILLIATAASKMLLYVGTYGLTRLRLYTLWFMLLLVCVFAVVVIWHVRPFNAGKPLAVIFAVLVLCLFLGNTDGIIAKYNTEGYMSGNYKELDPESMTYMSDAVVPYLNDLAKNAKDESVRDGANIALQNREDMADMMLWEDPNRKPTWRSWNLQSGSL